MSYLLVAAVFFILGVCIGLAVFHGLYSQAKDEGRIVYKDIDGHWIGTMLALTEIKHQKKDQ
jgi:hypothetical protein